MALSRECAERLEMAAGYLSDLERARSGLPSRALCAKIDSSFGTGLREQVESSRQRERELRATALAAHRNRRRRGSTSPTDPLILDVAEQLVGDRHLMRALRSLAALAPAERRVIAQFIVDLATSRGAPSISS